MSDDNDEITLSADTQKILNEFLKEQAERAQTEITNIQSKSNKNAKFEEDWQLSQFWYSETTKRALAAVIKKLVCNLDDKPQYRIALLSCPSLYSNAKAAHENVKIFEFDKRFEAFGSDFVHYDFNRAFDANYLHEHAMSYDLIIADPPFLSAECIEKVAHIIKKIKRSCVEPQKTKIIFCSGKIVEPWITQYLQLTKCKYRPEHERNLGNDFVSYANFDLDALIADT